MRFSALSFVRISRLALTLGLAASAALGASPRPAIAEIRNIVLVHGAFADASSWSSVIAQLQDKGYHVTAVQNPLTSLADDVAATRRVLERQQGDVILVGHSWAGAVVTQAGNAPNVKGIVYLSALVPDSGESVADLLQKRDAPMDGMKPDANGLVWLDDPAAYAQVMAADLPLAQVKLLAATQQPIAAAAFADKISHAAWQDKPTWYVVTLDDNALPPAVQQWTVQHIGARSITLKSSHMSLLSHASDVVGVIETAAREAGH